MHDRSFLFRLPAGGIVRATNPAPIPDPFFAVGRGNRGNVSRFCRASPKAGVARSLVRAARRAGDSPIPFLARLAAAMRGTLCGRVCEGGYDLASLPTRERWMPMKRTALLVAAVMAALVLTMTAGPLSQRGISPQPAQARLPALTVTVACKATPDPNRGHCSVAVWLQ